MRELKLGGFSNLLKVIAVRPRFKLHFGKVPGPEPVLRQVVQVSKPTFDKSSKRSLLFLKLT